MKANGLHQILLLGFALVILGGCAKLGDPGTPTLHTLEGPYPFINELHEGGVTGLARHPSGVFATKSPDENLNGPGITEQDELYGSLSKVDKNGNLLWKRFVRFGSPSPTTTAEGVASDAAENAYVLGETPWIADHQEVDPNNSVRDLYLRKYGTSYDSSRYIYIEGAILWTRHFGTLQKDEMAGDAAVYDNAVYIVGSSVGRLGTGGSTGGYDGFLRKYDSAGNLLWTTFITTSADDFANDVAVDDSGNIYVVGSTAGSLARFKFSNDADIFLRKYAQNGAVLWTRQLDYSSYDYGSAVAVSGNTVYLGGGFLYGLDSVDPYGRKDMDVLVVQFDRDGTKLAEYEYGTSMPEHLYDITPSNSFSGAFYIAGATSGEFAADTDWGETPDSFVMKLYSNGSKIWGVQEKARFLTRAILETTEFTWSGFKYQLYAGHGGEVFSDTLQRLNPNTGATLWTR